VSPDEKSMKVTLSCATVLMVDEVSSTRAATERRAMVLKVGCLWIMQRSDSDQKTSPAHFFIHKKKIHTFPSTDLTTYKLIKKMEYQVAVPLKN